jgi:hypothetical protein
MQPGLRSPIRQVIKKNRKLIYKSSNNHLLENKKLNLTKGTDACSLRNKRAVHLERGISPLKHST